MICTKFIILLLQANTLHHPPGIPFGLSNLVSRSPATFAVIERYNTYYESKIDHNKVIVVDANTDSPQAYFDNAIYIKGPTAARVQASYYDDVDAALTIEKQWFLYKECGFDNTAWLERRDELPDWTRIRRDTFPAAGDDVVRISEANVDGRIRDTRNMLVDMIRRAESNIYIEQLLIYDAYVIDALIKRRRQRTNLDIRIIADHNGNFMMNGFPNTMFLRELAAVGIPVRARNTLGIDFTFPDGPRHTFHQENHRKIMSVDGSVLLAGSSNLNPDTLQGSFREFGAQVFNRAEIETFESVFLRDWADDDATSPMVIDGWQMSFRNKIMPPETSALDWSTPRTGSSDANKANVTTERNQTIIDDEAYGAVPFIQAFDTEDEMIDKANDTQQYGLTAYPLIRNLDRALAICEAILAGAIGPFGGFKMSGLGRACSVEGIEAFLETKRVSIGI